MSEDKPTITTEEVLAFSADPRFRKRIAEAAMRHLFKGEEMDPDRVVLESMVQVIEEERGRNQA